MMTDPWKLLERCAGALRMIVPCHLRSEIDPLLADVSAALAERHSPVRVCPECGRGLDLLGPDESWREWRWVCKGNTGNPEASCWFAVGPFATRNDAYAWRPEVWCGWSAKRVAARKGSDYGE